MKIDIHWFLHLRSIFQYICLHIIIFFIFLALFLCFLSLMQLWNSIFILNLLFLFLKNLIFLILFTLMNRWILIVIKFLINLFLNKKIIFFYTVHKFFKQWFLERIDFRKINNIFVLYIKLCFFKSKLEIILLFIHLW